MTHCRSRIAVVVLASAALLLVSLPAGAVNWRAQIEQYSGLVKVQRAGRGEWGAVTSATNRMLMAGDHVQTFQKASATILIDGARVRLGARTHVIIPAQGQIAGPAGASRMWAVAGRVYVWLVGGRGFQIGTEGAVASAAGTRFVVDVDEAGLTTVAVFEGTVSFFNSLGQVAVHAYEQSTASPGTPPTRPVKVDPAGNIQWEPSLDDVALGWEFRHDPSAAPQQLRTDLAAALAGGAKTAADAVRIGELADDCGELEQAEAAYRQALELAPTDANAALNLALNLLMQNRNAEAQAAFGAVLGLQPGNAVAQSGVAAAVAGRGTPEALAEAATLAENAAAAGDPSGIPSIIAGVIASRRGDASRARKYLEAALAVAPDGYLAHAYLSALMLAGGDGSGALAAAHRAVDSGPNSGLAHAVLARAFFYGAGLSDAAEQAGLAIALSRNSAAAHLIASDVAVAQGDLALGRQEAQMAAALDPQSPAAFNALGMIGLALNDVKSAEKAFSQALAFGPSSATARVGMGMTYARQGKLGKALELQKAAISLDEDLAAAHNNLGAAYLALGDFAQAEKAFAQAVRLAPQSSIAHANLAMLYLDTNQYAEAVREGETAVRMGESSARVWTTLARVYLKQQRTERAWASLRRAVELDKDYALGHLELAEVYNRIGRSRDAVREQLVAISSDPAAMLESRDYSRTEVSLELGSFVGDIKKDGRGDGGQNSYFMRMRHENDDLDRLHSSWNTTSFLGIAGRQTAADTTDALLFSMSHEERDRPGRLVAGAPEDADYVSHFGGFDLQYLRRRPFLDDGTVTVKAGFRNSSEADYNPNSLVGDDKPFRGLKLEYEGPMAEVRVDKPLSAKRNLVLGAAASGETRRVTGVAGTRSATGTAAWEKFDASEDHDAVSAYLEHEGQLDARTRLLVGGRVAAAENTTPIWRPKASLRRQVSRDGTVALLTRPVIRDDVSELSPVEHWALRDWLSPLDLTTGGFSQTYELQYQLLPRSGSLLRLSAYYRTLRNFIIDLQAPEWSAGAAGAITASGSTQGAELEWERWLSPTLSAGVWARYTDSSNDEVAGRDIPYQPQWAGSARLDYMDATGLRACLQWLHVGKRYADMRNLTELDATNVFNLRFEKQADLHTEYFVEARNLFDKNYCFWADYPERGRDIRGGVRLRY
jgi:tetratricopeptide (TPR) repeat protein